MAAIDPFLEELVKRGGTNLHIGAGQPPLVRLRGELVPLRDKVLDAKESTELLESVLSPPHRARLNAELDIELAVTHLDSARFRASYFQRHGGLAAVFRVVPARVPSLAELGCPEVFWRLADRRAGLVLVTGPAASGKSTTLGALIDHINKTRACHVLTIEDPIELVHDPLRAQVTQREIGMHAPSFAVALRSAMRENPDVVLVSELRNAETIKLALQLASFGVLVFATMPTNGAVTTIERIVSCMPDAEQASVRGTLAESLVGIVAQQLVRTADGKGRVAVHEILLGSPAVGALIREGKTLQIPGVMQTGAAQGMQTLDTALERLMGAGRISPENALERAVDKEAFAKVVGRVRPDLVDPPS